MIVELTAKQQAVLLELVAARQDAMFAWVLPDSELRTLALLRAKLTPAKHEGGVKGKTIRAKGAK